MRFPLLDRHAIQTRQRCKQHCRGNQHPPFSARPCRQRAPHGEQGAHQQFFGECPPNSTRRLAGVNTREICERSHSQNRIAFARTRWHPTQHDSPHRASRRNGHRRKYLPVSPMEIMPLTQFVAAAPQTRVRVEQPVADIHRPNHEHLQRQDPQRQLYSCYPGKRKRPDNRDGRCIQAGQVPKAHRSWRFPKKLQRMAGFPLNALLLEASLIAIRRARQVTALRGGRIEDCQRHCSDFRGRRRA